MLDLLVRFVHRGRLDSNERSGRLFLGALESLEACVDTFPTRAHEIDEEREIVHTSVPLGEQLAFEPLESADRLVEQPADLGDVSRDRQDFCAKAVPNCASDLSGDRGLELGRCDGECLDLAA